MFKKVFNLFEKWFCHRDVWLKYLEKETFSDDGKRGNCSLNFFLKYEDIPSLCKESRIFFKYPVYKVFGKFTKGRTAC